LKTQLKSTRDITVRVLLFCLHNDIPRQRQVSPGAAPHTDKHDSNKEQHDVKICGATHR